MSKETKKERSMPRSNGAEMNRKKQSTQVAVPLHLKTKRSTSSSESIGVKSHCPVRGRSPKLDEYRRSPEVGVCTQRKRGNRVADLETRLGHAKEETRKLKKQLASTENAKKGVQTKLEETKKLICTGQQRDKDQSMDEKIGDKDITEGDNTDVPEKENEEIPNFRDIPIPVDSKVMVLKEEEPYLNLGLEEKIAKKQIEIEGHIADNTALKKQIEEANISASAAKLKEAELGIKVRSLTEELEHSVAKSDHLEEQLEAMEAAKIQLETEMKRLRVQTDQWRKAADAAAAIISGDGPVGTINGNIGSLLMESELEDKTSANGQRKIAGIRMLGELWRKKGR